MGNLVQPTMLPPPLARDQSCRALEAIAATISSTDLTPLIVYDFDSVPASALPSLAEQLRVQGDAGWSFATTEEQQRELLKNAIALHRLRGTMYAVTQALSILGVDVTVTEWFETQPQGLPYTFTISADPLDQPDGSPPLDLTRWTQIASMANFWKNARSAFSLSTISSPVTMELGITMVVGGQAATSIAASFDGDSLSMSSFVSLTLGGADSQSLGATFA
jgi:phage tail P2-like protein